MAVWPLIPRQAAHRGGGHLPHRTQLPLFYMNDYSRLGLRVDARDAALRGLAERRYAVAPDGWAAVSPWATPPKCKPSSRA
jgi:hypothetical protein